MIIMLAEIELLKRSRDFINNPNIYLYCVRSHGLQLISDSQKPSSQFVW
jgi:hypothetical protein